jgi:hypothetical protein
MKKLIKESETRRLVLIGAGIFVLGLIVAFTISIITTPRYATGAEVEAARKAIAEKFINESSVACTDTSDPISPTGRIVVFYKYLRINRYADRAVIRGCNNIDSLLAKTKQGAWIKTNVNMNLDARANPRWQNACNIADITVADDEVRPENASIDEFNFDTCLKLRRL